MKNLCLFSFVVFASFSSVAFANGDEDGVAAPAVVAQAPLVQSTDVQESEVAAPAVSRKRSLEGISESSETKKVRDLIARSQDEPSTPRKTRPTTQSFMSPQALSASAETSLLSPVSKSFKLFSPTRRAFLKAKYNGGAGKSQVVPVARKHELLDATLPAYIKENVVNYRGERIFIDETLFQLDQDFLTHVNDQYVWMSNRDRMALGHAPVCYKGYTTPENRATLSQDEIVKIQRRNTIELHHLDQREQGYGLVMLVPGLHRGMGSAYYINCEDGEVKIEASRITPSKRATFKKTRTQKVVKDVLHSRQPEGSQINRDAFTKFRENFWKSFIRQSPSLVRTQSRLTGDDDGIAPTALRF